MNGKRKGSEKGLDSRLLLSTCPHAWRTVDPRAESIYAHSKQKCRGPFGLCYCGPVQVFMPCHGFPGAFDIQCEKSRYSVLIRFASHGVFNPLYVILFEYLR
jgi:hypothetical protein